MAKQKIYFSIRVVKAINKDKAADKIFSEEYEEDHTLCDEIMTTEELIQALLLELENQQNKK